MNEDVRVEGPFLKMGEVCQEILDDLPEWFGIEEAKQQYVKTADELPMFVARAEAQAVGFMSLLVHSLHSAELYVLGVKRRYHGQGIGYRLLLACENYLSGTGVEFLQVKTLADSHADQNYQATRNFYQRAGFVPLEVFPHLWDEHNPCLQMIKYIAHDRFE